MSEGNKTAVSGALEQLKAAHQSQDLAGIESGMEALNTAWSAASQEMYNATQGAEGGAGQPGPDAATEDASGDGVSDVDYEEVNEEDKK